METGDGWFSTSGHRDTWPAGEGKLGSLVKGPRRSLHPWSPGEGTLDLLIRRWERDRSDHKWSWPLQEN